MTSEMMTWTLDWITMLKIYFQKKTNGNSFKNEFFLQGGELQILASILLMDADVDMAKNQIYWS